MPWLTGYAPDAFGATWFQVSCFKSTTLQAIHARAVEGGNGSGRDNFDAQVPLDALRNLCGVMWAMTSDLRSSHFTGDTLDRMRQNAAAQVRRATATAPTA